MSRKDHPLHSTWLRMRERCQNPKHNRYYLYGGRGIAVCERWQSFENFAADMGKRPPGASLDRIDNNGPYSPENCRWATREQQANNRRDNRLITHNGKTKCVKQWAKETGMYQSTILRRLNRGLPAEEIFA